MSDNEIPLRVLDAVNDWIAPPLTPEEAKDRCENLSAWLDGTIEGLNDDIEQRGEDE